MPTTIILLATVAALVITLLAALVTHRLRARRRRRQVTLQLAIYARPGSWLDLVSPVRPAWPVINPTGTSWRPSDAWITEDVR